MSNTEPVPRQCPFCGSPSINTHEGLSFHAWLAQCAECGASSGEIRRQTTGAGTNDDWDRQAALDAIAAWNMRALDSDIDITWTPSADRLDIGGFYDSFVGIPPISMTLGQFFEKLGITEKHISKAMRNHGLQRC